MKEGDDIKLKIDLQDPGWGEPHDKEPIITRKGSKGIIVKCFGFSLGTSEPTHKIKVNGKIFNTFEKYIEELK